MDRADDAVYGEEAREGDDSMCCCEIRISKSTNQHGFKTSITGSRKFEDIKSNYF